MDVHPGLGAAQGALAGAAITLGNFDGLHLGHRRLVEVTVADARARGAKAAALTFRPHPAAVLAPSMAPRLIATEGQTRALFAAAGIDVLVEQRFDPQFAQVEPEAFEGLLLDGLGVRTVVVGYDFSYGRRRGGSTETLREACEARGVRLVVVPAVTVGGLVASSSQVREFVLQGNVEGAARLLGRPYELTGAVVRGDGRGRTIGVPTANVAAENELLPGIGVYAVRARLPDGTWADGACNVGVNPTFKGEGGREVSVEVHLVDRSVDLYGQRLAVAFVARLRAERRFASVDALVTQIRADVADARRVLSQPAPEAP
jgi:riboflavin kinase/FMN adenylyltransferase